MAGFRTLLVAVSLLFLGFSQHSPLLDLSDQESNSPSREAGQELKPDSYYNKWLLEDVLYIISPEEKEVFGDLTTDEERENFIEQFWLRRDPDPRTANNEFKEEHYRRIAYANDRFHSGIPGWQTDRGRIYITFGPPTEIESRPTGGTYNREYWEGGGTTAVYPFERWRYRYIEGVGDDIEIEFVDRTFSGEYVMAMSPDEKDALMNVPGAGLTLWEELGMTEKKDRPYFNPGMSSDPYQGQLRAKDQPFARMEQFFNLQRPPKIRFEDLKSAVSTNISYNELPYRIRTDFIRLSADKVLVPVTVEIENRDLEFSREFEINRAVVNVYGLVTGLTGRIIAEFEHSITVEYTDEKFERGKQSRSMYQKIIALPPGQHFKLDLALKDSQSGHTGIISRGIKVPKYGGEELEASSIILANSIISAPVESSDYLEQFVIGDLKIQPNVKSEYMPEQFLIPYMQIYNAAVDQVSLEPLVQITYALKSEGKTVQELEDREGETVQFFSGERLVIIGRIPLQSIQPGKYELQINVIDQIRNKSLIAHADFTVF
jgi:GWxTD domain-containing protein